MMQDRLKTPELKQLYGYWAEKRGDRDMPSRGDLDPVEMAAFIQFVVLLDVEEAPRRYRFRVIGTGIVDGFGEDRTGGYFDEVDLGDVADEASRGLDEVVETRSPRYLTGEFVKKNGRHIRFERISLPLSSNGTDVDMIFNGVAYMPLSDKEPVRA